MYSVFDKYNKSLLTRYTSNYVHNIILVYFNVFFVCLYRVEDMLRWVSGVNNVASVQPVQERPLDLLPEGNLEIIINEYFQTSKTQRHPVPS